MKRASDLISTNGDGDREDEEKEDQERNIGKRSQFLSCSTRTNSSSSTAMAVCLPPRDIIISEILTRVSLGHLICRCRLVCKDWRDVTYDSDFKFLHSQKSPTIFGCLLRMVLVAHGKVSFKFVSINNNQDDHSEKVPISTLPPPNFLDFLPLTPERQLFYVLSSSSPHGLFLCYIVSFAPGTGEESSRCFYICKPATREWQKIPNPPRDTSNLSTLKIAIVVVKQEGEQQEQEQEQQQQQQRGGQQRVNPLHYKIIRLGFSSKKNSGGKRSNYLECETFDSINWEWKRYPCKMRKLPKCFARANPWRDPGILVHGAVHWISICEPEICALDINMPGSLKVIPPPSDEQLLNEMHDYYASKHDLVHYPCARLVEYEGELGLLNLGFRKRLTLELWVLRDYNSYCSQLNKTIIWNKIYLIDLGPGYGEIHLLNLNCKVLQLYTKGIILMQIEDEVIWYNRKTGTRSVAFKIPAGYQIPIVHPFHSDLLPCNF